MQNNYCDGSTENRCLPGQVRLYPIGGGGNMIYCRACFQRENQYRSERGKETGNSDNWPQHDWEKSEIYSAGI